MPARYLILLPVLTASLLVSCATDYYSLNHRLNDLNTPCTSQVKRVTVALEDFGSTLPLDDVGFQLYDPTTGSVERLSRDSWIAAPIYLLNNVLRESLAQASPFNGKVTVLPAGSRADYTMSGAFTQMRIEADDDDPQYVEVAFHTRVFRWGADPRSDAPVLERTYRHRATVEKECVEKIPEATNLAMAKTIDTLMKDLCGRLADPAGSDLHLVAASTPCRDICAFRFQAESGQRGRLNLALLDRDGDVVENVDLVGFTSAGGGTYRGTGTGSLQGLGVTIAIDERSGKSSVTIRGLLRGEVTLRVADADAGKTEKWLEGK